MRAQDWLGFVSLGAALLALAALLLGYTTGFWVCFTLALVLGVLTRFWSVRFPAPIPYRLRWTLRVPRALGCKKGGQVRTTSRKKRPAPTLIRVAALLMLFTSLPLSSQETDGFRDSLEREWGSAVARVQQIGAAIPESMYGWRPGEGVRSVSEVLMHIAGGNFGHAEILGESRPEDLPEDLSKVVAKEEVLAIVGSSVESLESAMKRAFGADLDQALPRVPGEFYFGTPRRVLMRAVAHNHEHGGQLVAYARMNGVVPPWSR